MSLTPIEEMSDRIQGLRERAPDLELVVLFGSTVKGRRRAGSDVDVAVRCAGLADLDVLHRLLAPALGSERLDLIDLRDRKSTRLNSSHTMTSRMPSSA